MSEQQLQKDLDRYRRLYRGKRSEVRQVRSQLAECRAKYGRLQTLYSAATSVFAGRGTVNTLGWKIGDKVTAVDEPGVVVELGTCTADGRLWELDSIQIEWATGTSEIYQVPDELHFLVKDPA